MAEEEIIIGGIYKHFKNKRLYKVKAMAKNSSDLSDMVVYEAQYENPEARFWVRPVAEFVQEVYWEGKTMKRFEKI